MILITGGCGYIGSHLTLQLLERGFEIVIIDDLSSSKISTIHQIEKKSKSTVKFYEGDVRNPHLVNKIFLENNIQFVFHFAGLKSVSKSFMYSKDYFDVNINGTLNLIKYMSLNNIKNLIFSSSATVYDINQELPFKEISDVNFPESPYGQTKFICEKILENMCYRKNEWKIGILRYFNPIGSHSSSIICENFTFNNDNLIPNIAKVISKKTKFLEIFGNDYETNDGTCERDFIHIMDLIDGHIAAMNFYKKRKGFNIWNLGTGKPISVLKIVKEFEKVSGEAIPYKFKERRNGDLDISYADPTKAIKELDWKPTRGIENMIIDSFNSIINLK